MELTSGVIHAQPQTEISIGGDLVSTYVWRGVYQSGFSLQPEIGLSVGGFTVGVWGSTDLDNFKVWTSRWGIPLGVFRSE